MSEWNPEKQKPRPEQKPKKQPDESTVRGLGRTAIEGSKKK